MRTFHALTGMGLTIPIITLISAFSSLFGTGGAPLAAIKLGKSKPKDAQRILGISAFMLLCTSALLFVLFQLFIDSPLMVFGASENPLPYAKAYLSIYHFHHDSDLSHALSFSPYSFAARTPARDASRRLNHA